jgi:hypothetical protein
MGQLKQSLGTSTSKDRTTADEYKNGKMFLTITSNFSPEIPEATKMITPTGRVIIPSIKMNDIESSRPVSSDTIG